MPLEQRRNWYSPVADVYYHVRAKYPPELVDRTVVLARLSPATSLLEIGCGPGNATVAVAPVGCAMTCLEPNVDFCRLACEHCASYPNVTIDHTTFEEWQVPATQFDALLAANSWHWLAPKIKYAKAAAALRQDGHLILLWNLTPELPAEVYQAIESVFQAYAPSLARYEGAEIQAEILQGFGREILDSGYFDNLVIEQTASTVTYSIDRYLQLLSTFGRLEPSAQELLFAGVRAQLAKFGDRVQLSFLSATCIARKASSRIDN